MAGVRILKGAPSLGLEVIHSIQCELAARKGMQQLCQPQGATEKLAQPHQCPRARAAPPRRGRPPPDSRSESREG